MGSDAAFRASCMTQHQQAMALAFPWQQHHQWLNSRYETNHNLQQHQQQQQNLQQHHQNAQQNHQQHQNGQQNGQQSHQNGQQNHQNSQQNHQNGQQPHQQHQNSQQNHQNSQQNHQNSQQNHQNGQQNHQQHQNSQQNHQQHQNGQQNQQQQSHHQQQQNRQQQNNQQQQQNLNQQNQQQQQQQQNHQQHPNQQQNHQQQQQNHQQQQQQQNNQQQSQPRPTPQQRQSEQTSQPPPLIQLPPPPPPKRYLIAGKSCGKEIVPVEKKDENELWSNVEAQAAFLGPNLWEKTLPYDADLKYVDLDEFLSENGIPVENGGGGGVMTAGPQGGAPQPGGLKPTQLPGTDHSGGRISPSGSNSQQSLMLQTKRERSPSPSEPMSPLNISPPSPADSTLSFASSSRDFDPRTRAFSDEELKPQPMVKKSRKQFVPDGLKDEKYWARRRKNNMAAKRSRDARRLKENQIALRAGFLEKENLGLRQEMERLKKENLALRDRLSEFTDI
ncbi:alpha-protein kinase 1 isoform X4 [Nilaparvata lugens]|uniref:alpha-protein kinase 1 isoform X4 n=1 Tax=Nilaparvata lugens TaxID=108931 RepID=UPI00193C99DE|nr:alpha-protein kinase 1 isoform X4 [Nilaparvata lugens]